MSIHEYDEVKHMRQTGEEEHGDRYNNEYDNGFDSEHDNGYNSRCENERDRINLLIIKLHEAGRVEDLINAANNIDYQKRQTQKPWNSGARYPTIPQNSPNTRAVKLLPVFSQFFFCF